MSKIKIWGVLVLLMLLAYPAWAAPSIPPAPKENSYVYDLAGMLDEEQEQELMAIGAALEQESGAEVVVVTVSSLDGYPIEDYANALFRTWGIGDKKKNNGVLLLVNQENALAGKSGRIRIEVGYGLEGAIPDGRAGRILDEFVLPAWEEGRYGAGIYQGYLAIASAVADEYQIEINKDQTLAPLKNYTTNDGNHQNGFLFEILIFIIIVLILASMNGRGSRRQNYTGPFWGGPFKGGGGGFGSGGFGGGSSGGGGASR